MILGLRAAIDPVGDRQRAKAWYAQLLGQPPSFDQPFAVGFSVGGFEPGLLPGGEPGTAGPRPPWGVADARAAWARLLELGATALEPVQDVGEGILAAAVTDPFGNHLGIIENPHFDPKAVRWHGEGAPTP